VGNAVTITVVGGTKKFSKIPSASGAGVYVPPPGDASTLVVNADRTITLTDKSQLVTTFDADGMISSCGRYWCTSTLAGALNAAGATAPVVTTPLIGCASKASRIAWKVSASPSKKIVLRLTRTRGLACGLRC